MAESSNSKLPTLIFGGLISVIVGVASGYGVNWLSEKKAELTYDVTSIQAFPGQERIGIVAVRITNSGKKELENIDATVRFSDAEVKEIIFQGLTPQTSSKEGSGIRFQIPFLNPAEDFSVQILVSPNKQVLQTPMVDLRAKGAVGIPANRSAENVGSKKELWTLTASAAMALVALSMAVLLSRKLTKRAESVYATPHANIGTGHEGDQRDVFAYILGSCGLHEDAGLIRSCTRDLSYWSISDLLTDRWIASGNEANIRAGATALDRLISYALLAQESVRIIQINIARLYVAVNDEASARKYVALSTSENDPIISKRLVINPAIAQLKQQNA